MLDLLVRLPGLLHFSSVLREKLGDGLVRWARILIRLAANQFIELSLCPSLERMRIVSAHGHASTKDRAAHEGEDVLMPLLDLEIWSRKTRKPRTPAAERYDEAQQRAGQHDGLELHLAQVPGGEEVVDLRAESYTTSRMCPWVEVKQEYVIVHVLGEGTASPPPSVDECHGESCVEVASCQ